MRSGFAPPWCPSSPPRCGGVEPRRRGSALPSPLVREAKAREGVEVGRLEVEARVSEVDLFGIAPGQAVHVTGPAGRAIEAEVRAIAPIVDARTRLGTVYIALPPDSGLKPGMFARADIADDRPMALAVPQKALVWRNGRNAVFAVHNGKASLRPVKTGMRRDGWIEITEGLTPGDRVAVDGAGFLKDGDSVRVELAEAESASREDNR